MNTDLPPEQLAARVEGTLLDYCRQQELFCPGDCVIAACSGGADSMALLLFLLRCQEQLGIKLMAAHVDHGIRGAAARADADFVADFCRRQGVPLLRYSAQEAGVPVPPHASEDWARRLRYQWFDTLAVQYQAKVATAHTMTDQAETVLFRLARGSGVHGAAGILPRRGPYVRPLLCLQRADTEAYCAALGQSYVLDATNADQAYARNRIRQEALPALTAVNSAATASLCRFAEQMRALDGYLQQQGEELLTAAAAPRGAYRLAVLRAAPQPVLEAALYQLLARFAVPQREQVRRLAALVRAGQGAVQLAPRVRVSCAPGSGCLSIEAAPACAPAPRPDPPCAARPGTYALAGGYGLELCLGPAQKYEKFIKNGAFCKKGLNSYADYDKIMGYLSLRTRQPGDRFQPAGRVGHRTLKKYLNEQRIPAGQRALLPLLAVGHEVVWLWGSGFAAGYAPDTATHTVLEVRQLQGPGCLWI